jgi:hypothetical protein
VSTIHSIENAYRFCFSRVAGFILQNIAAQVGSLVARLGIGEGSMVPLECPVRSLKRILQLRTTTDIEQWR